MNFADLHERLRLELLRRIEAGSLTGSRLAQQAGFQQAHISNFLNRKRALSLEGLDRVLAAQNISIDQILPAEKLDISASATPSDLQAETVPLVPPSIAMDDPRVHPSSVIESVPVSSSLLYENRPRTAPEHTSWHRFVAIRVDAQQATAMDPLLASGSIVVIDRHYTSLALYRSHHPNLYAVRCGSALALRFVDFDDGHLILRPFSISFPVQLLPVRTGHSPSEFIVGRVCLVLSEL